MELEQALQLISDLGDAMKQKFPKVYSSVRMDQLEKILLTASDVVTALHEEAAREEDTTRKESVVQRMILEGQGRVSPSDATAAVERGER